MFRFLIESIRIYEKFKKNYRIILRFLIAGQEISVQRTKYC